MRQLWIYKENPIKHFSIYIGPLTEMAKNRMVENESKQIYKKGESSMNAEERYHNNQQYLRATSYMKRMFDTGLITKEQMRKAIRYYAEKFDSSIRIFL